MFQCENCGGDMIGDGYTMVIRCENADIDEFWCNAPDDGPILCTNVDEITCDLN